ncbi:MAG TPA: MarR family transcriptional regulator [Devosiaceae bacterium]|nr:MarR family transcriptional regulator [Devosiaceae bacterium]
MQVTDADYEALAAFRRGLRGFLAFSEAQARTAGLTPQQHQALLAIRGRSSRTLTVGELADDLILKPHSALELADRLVGAGLVNRNADPSDRRRVALTLTPRAEELLAALSAAHLAELERQRELLGKLMDRLDGRA